jgi:hypothetical protein
VPLAVWSPRPMPPARLVTLIPVYLVRAIARGPAAGGGCGLDD